MDSKRGIKVGLEPSPPNESAADVNTDGVWVNVVKNFTGADWDQGRAEAIRKAAEGEQPAGVHGPVG